VVVGGQPAKASLEPLRIAIDRGAEVPIGVQIAWAIRARIGDGTLTPGQRLPGIRELAEATGVNFNTIRVVYQRLECHARADRSPSRAASPQGMQLFPDSLLITPCLPSNRTPCEATDRVLTIGRNS